MYVCINFQVPTVFNEHEMIDSVHWLELLQVSPVVFSLSAIPYSSNDNGLCSKRR